ncbi:MAG: ribonuclease P protein component [Acidimicrobiales bacterium]
MIGRVGDRASFSALAAHGRRARSGPITVTWVGGPGDASQVAYAIGRRVGGAVQRNRLRRRLRAIVAELAPDLPAGTYLVSAGPAATTTSSGELRTLVRRAMTQFDHVAARSGTL